MKTILNKYQIIFLEEFKKHPTLKNMFYLTGGTALAEFYLRHRLSEDIDLFTYENFDLKAVDLFINRCKDIIKPKDLYRQKIYDRYNYNFVLKDTILKIEFVKYEFKNLKPLIKRNNLFVNDVYDIAVNKFFTLFDRNETKDFVDLFFLLKKFTLNQLIRGVKIKFGFNIDPIMIGGELLKIKKNAFMPKMLTPLTREELTDFFEKQALKLREKIFDF